MKRIWIYIFITAAAIMVPVKRTDVGKLLPVEVVSIRAEAGNIGINTDTGNSGEGKTVEEAFRHMEETAAGVIFLDTASYLLLEDETKGLSNDLAKYLKPWTRVCCTDGDIDLSKVAVFLEVHRPNVKLEEFLMGAEAEELISIGDEMIIVEKSKNNA